MSQSPALYIRSKHEPYRRAGFAHSRAGFGVALDALTEDQVTLLKNDPHLTVEECTFDSEEDAEAEAAEKAAAKEATDKAAAEAATKEEAEKAAAAENAAKKEAERAAAEVATKAGTKSKKAK